MRPRFSPSLSAALLAATLLAACGSSTDSGSSTSAASTSGFPVTVERCDRDVTVESPPQRIVSLNQGSTEILLSLGVADRMAGAAGWTDPILPSLAEENATVERLADQAPSYEDLLATEPDLVTASFANTLSEGGVTTPEKLAGLGVPAYLSAVECEKSDFGAGDGTRDEPLEMESIYTEVRDLAALVGEEQAGEDLVASLEERMADAAAADFDGTSVFYWFANSEAPYAAGCCGGPGIITRALGLDNVFEGEQDEWPQIGWESIAATDPDVLVIGDLTRRSQTAESGKAKIAFLESNPVTREMTAVKEKRYVLLAGAELNPSIRTVDAVEKVAAGLRDLGISPS
ncbi:ABC transporter substrate-binding protein [Aeromicrobium sp. Leaf291]|uniref:ABC transporter substrate-binding protein n=1 Tax=Aeromicrobium sp. Leaf291 TaxID=1736325 RepID=UPI0006FB4028|nr:ABC transporter substrate-binding protein [Aeromicrobium sp. Leaf291]KQP83458.1 ABC transporter substrate-binding protein [Aeromicrobium sp. Leaf291]